MLIKNKKLLFYTVLLITLFSSCSFLSIEEPTYKISSIKTVNGITEDFEIAGLVFVLKNLDNRDISSISFEFDIYDTDGNQQPGIGKNHVESSIEINILSEMEDSVTVAFDSKFSKPLLDSLTATRFCITKIEYSDGSRWRDILKQYQIMVSEIEVETL